MTEHELTRRDALAALAAGGATVAGAGALAWDRLGDDGTDEPLTETDRETILAVAETIYPTEVAGVAEFVETYVVGRIVDRPAYADGAADAIAALDDHARAWEDAPYRELDRETRDDLLGSFGVDIAAPDPEGVPRERVRYYLVNELQYALYTSPTGGELLGLENPQGHPGGTDSYRRPPEDS